MTQRRFRFSATRTRPPPLPYQGKELLLSRGEMAFYRALRRSVAQSYLIAFKVRAADLLCCSESAWAAGFGHMVARHHLDFVLCDLRTTRIVAAIELDDRSHNASQRIKRDRFLDRAFAAAGVPLIRFTAAARYYPDAISRHIHQTVSRDGDFSRNAGRLRNGRPNGGVTSSFSRQRL